MQNVKFYVAAPQTLGTVRDYANAKNESAPTLVRGCEVELKMRLFANSEGTAPYPMEQLDGIVSWQWAMDRDFNEATGYILEADHAHISASSVRDEVDGTEIEYTEISIPISNMNTEELVAWLETSASRNQLHGELIGFDAQGRQVFVLQVENFTIRNRITSLGTPTPIVPDYLTAAQVRSLIAAGIQLQFSENGTQWHDAQTDKDHFYRMRSASDENAAWSEAVSMIPGPRGENGSDSFCYVAYASDNAGNDFSITPSNTLKYRAEIHVPEALETPSEADFSNAVWVKYLGDDGQGVGDMVQAVYDTDNDGKVNAAQNADHATAADAVPWDGVSGKPADFNPSAHTHAMADVSNPVSQKIREESNPSTLYLDTPVLRNTWRNDSGTIELNFTSVMTKEDGASAYSIARNEMLTWEYHVLCGTSVNGVSLGSMNCSMVGINIPETLELINGGSTWHVFVIRAVYRSGAVNNICFQANYAYSYEA